LSFGWQAIKWPKSHLPPPEGADAIRDSSAARRGECQTS